jgi:hypothetical protein
MDFYHKDFDATLILINNIPIDDFEGFSSADMNYLVYESFSPDSPLQINKNIPDNLLDQIPFLLQIEYLLKKINDLGELKLTAKGFLPTTLVKEIYDLGLIKDYAIEKGITKLYAETSSQPINLTRLITELAGFTKKRYNKLTLTKTWRDKLLKKSRQDIFNQTFSTFAQKFNWGYFDLYSSQATGTVGFAYSLFLLSKYGDIERHVSFYSEKYLKAFPSLIDLFKDDPWVTDINRSFNSCYSIRTFDRFLDYFNLITIKSDGRQYDDSKKFIKKSPIFDEIITFEN